MSGCRVDDMNEVADSSAIRRVIVVAPDQQLLPLPIATCATNGTYDFLEVIYRVYVDWKCRKIAKRSVRTLADQLVIVRRKGMSPIRVLIEATHPNADFKRKSRWVRALEYVYSESVSPSQFRKFVRTRGGVAGCARLAVNVNRKRRRPGGDWID
jgi:hypothetical protein